MRFLYRFIPTLRSQVHLLVAVIAIAIAITHSSAAQTDYFLKIPDIEGEATDRDHKDWIIIQSVSSGLNRPAQGNASSGDFVLIKEVDKSSPKLMEACATGSVLPSAEVEILRVDESTSAVTYYRIKMKNVLVTSYQTGSTDSEVGLEDTFKLAPEEITWIYTEYDVTGRPNGDISFYWDIVRGETALRETFVVRTAGETKDGQLSLSWKTTPGKEFQIYSSDSLGGAFKEYGQPVPVNERGEGGVDLPVELGNRFFRFEEVDSP